MRVHGTTREHPLEQFAIERPLMTVLPVIAPDLGTWCRVTLHRDCHVQHERLYYSAPFTLVGRRLWLRATDNAVTIYEDYRLVATHPRGRKPGSRFTVQDHLPPDAQAFFARDRSWCVKQASAVGPACSELVEQLLTDRVVERLRAAQGVIGLGEKYGAARLETACSRALNHGSFHYRTVKHILAGGFDQQPQLVSAESPKAYAAGTRFTRDALSLFTPKSRPH